MAGRALCTKSRVLNKRLYVFADSWVDKCRTACGSERMLALNSAETPKKISGIECSICSLPQAVLHLSPFA